MTVRRTKATSRGPRPLPAAAVVLIGIALMVLVKTVGVTAVVLLSGVVGAFAVVVLAAVRRRPIDVER